MSYRLAIPLCVAAFGLAGIILAVADPATPTPSLASANPSAAAEEQPKVLVIGIDGSMLEVIDRVDTPALDSLREAGLTAPSLLPADHVTYSGPGWSSITTGVWSDKHQVTSNDLSTNDYATYPGFLTRVERGNAELDTYAVSSWAPLASRISGGPLFSDEVDAVIATPDSEHDAGTTLRAVEHLAADPADATFVHLGAVDLVGHEHGPGSEEYRAAVAEADGQVGQQLDAIASRDAADAEDWLVIVTSDHGHRPEGGHGGGSDDERAAFVIASGSGIPAGSEREDVAATDIAPTALEHLGVVIDPGWDLDGTGLGSAP